MFRLRRDKAPLSFADLLTVFTVHKGEAITGIELRISVLSSYILVLLTFIAIPPNLIIAIRTQNIIGIILVSTLTICILSAPITYWITKNYTAFRRLLTISMIILIGGIIEMGGGPTGVGLFYVFVMTPFFYFILGWVMAALLPFVTLALTALRFYLFGIDPASIFLLPRIGPAFIVAFCIGSLSVSAAVVTMRGLANGLSLTAYRDAVTLLPNRIKTEEVIGQYISRANLDRHRFGLIGIKLGHFNRAAAMLDRERADAILRNAANRLQSHMNPNTFLGRFSGSVFIAIAETDSQDQVKRLADKLLSVVNSTGAEDFPLVPQAVITRYPEDGDDAERLISNVMTTLQIRPQPGSEAVFYDISQYNKEAERLKLGALLPGAIERGEIYLAYQPRVSADEQRAIGAEILLRWEHAELGIVPPSLFIPVAEELGIIRNFTRWILNQASRDIATVHERYPQRTLVHGINLSPYDLASPMLFHDIDDCIRPQKLPSTSIEFEITEGMLIDDNPRVETNLDELENRGYKLAIDDFGTGYSNLRYLQRFHVNTLKIDQSFIKDIGQDAGSRHIVDAIVLLTQSLGLHCVAEGVETAVQFECLKESGCHYMQGNYFCAPSNLPQYMDWLSSH